MKIFITGATGFVGAHLVRYYARLGHQLVAICRQENPPNKLLELSELVRLDLQEETYPTFEGDVMIHAAGMATDRGTYSAFYKSNVESTKKLYQHFKGEHFVYISSASVYPFSSISLNEQHPIDNAELSDYGQSKLEAEKVLIDIKKNSGKITILRPRSIYGTNDRVLLPKILKLYKKKIRLIGSMDFDMSMTHISNLIEAIDASIKYQQSNLKIYNVADSQIYNLKEVVVGLISKIHDGEIGITKVPIGFLKSLTAIAHAFGIPFILTPQSLNYLSKPCVLDLDHIKKDLSVELKNNFFDELKGIADWVNKVGLDKVKAADPLLPWLGL